jgi:hypothetical protein
MVRLSGLEHLGKEVQAGFRPVGCTPVDRDVRGRHFPHIRSDAYNRLGNENR